jgi:hypothetical protein
MPAGATLARAKKDLKQGKSASTAAGEFVREEIEHVREGKHGARSAKQAIAIGLSKARRAGVPLEPPARGSTSPRVRQAARRDLAVGEGGSKRSTSAKRSAASLKALQGEAHSTASPQALAKQARRTAAKRKATRRRHAKRS